MAAQRVPEARLTDVEALMWRLEHFDARYRPVITIVVLLDASPGLAALTHRVDVLSRALPRFRCRVAPAPGPLGPLQWVPDDEFDLARHVRLAAATGEGTLEGVLADAALAAGDPLDTHRPPWQFTLVEGMAGGRAAVVVRLHHIFTDGLGALKLAMVLFDLDADAPAPDLPPLEGHVAPAAVERMAGDVAHEAARLAGLARWAVPTVRGLLRGAVTDPDRTAGEALRAAEGLARALTPTVRPLSPVLAARSTGAVFGALQADLADIHSTAASAGCTVNDVFLSALLDGLRRYHDRHGSRPDELRLGMPVSVRPSGDERLRNQFFPARFAAPLQLADPLERLQAVHELVLAARRDPALAAGDHLAAVAGRVPGVEAGLARVLGSIDVMASNVPGSPDPLHLAGARVARLIPFGPRSGAALNLTTVSYDGSLHIGVNVDPAAAPDADLLLGSLRDAFDEAVIYA